MKRDIIFSLVLFSIFVAFGVRAEISFNIDPVISDGGHDEFVKYTDVVTGEEKWGQRRAYVVVAGSMDGLGYGQGTLKNVSILTSCAN